VLLLLLLLLAEWWLCRRSSCRRCSSKAWTSLLGRPGGDVRVLSSRTMGC
jgi:hypothetical protein